MKGFLRLFPGHEGLVAAECRGIGAWMPYAEYTVRLDAFEGPLDLLLFLIRRAEVEVTDIPIATITDQYLKYVEQLTQGASGGGAGGSGGGAGFGNRGGLDIERAGEFLVMAATLMEIKSRTLTPPAPVGAGEDGVGTESESMTGQRSRAIDPRTELVQQLLEYKRFRDASEQLESFRHEWHARFPAGRALAAKSEEPEAQPELDEQVPVEIEDISLVDLVEAFAKIIESVDFSRVGEHHVLMDDTPVELHAEDIIDRLRRSLSAAGEGNAPARAEWLQPGEMEFVEIFRGRSRVDTIGLFLALLELVKQQRLTMRQESADATGKRIVVKLAEEAEVPTPHAQPEIVIKATAAGESEQSRA